MATSQKRFECVHPGCMVKCTRKQEMDRHMSEKHGGAKHCPVEGCPYKTQRMARLILHIENEHPSLFTEKGPKISLSKAVPHAVLDVHEHRNIPNSDPPTTDPLAKGPTRKANDLTIQTAESLNNPAADNHTQRKRKRTSTVDEEIAQIREGISETLGNIFSVQCFLRQPVATQDIFMNTVSQGADAIKNVPENTTSQEGFRFVPELASKLPISHYRDEVRVQFTCATCGKAWDNGSQLKRCEKRHSRPFKCDRPNCKNVKGFASENELKRHADSKHADSSGEVTQSIQYVCRYKECKSGHKLWPRLDNFRSHLRRVHKYTAEELGKESEIISQAVARNLSVAEKGIDVRDVDKGIGLSEAQTKQDIENKRGKVCE